MGCSPTNSSTTIANCILKANVTPAFGTANYFSLSSRTDRPTQLLTRELQSCFQCIPAIKLIGPASQQAPQA